MPAKSLFEFSALHNSDFVSLSFSVATWLVVVIILGLIALLVFNYRYLFCIGRVNLKKISLNLPGGKVEFEVKRTQQNLEIAHKILIELITRKAAIPFDEDHDVITEIYDSWYLLFCSTRDEIKLISGELLKHPKSEELVEMATDVLNKGLRPHLTKHQARFRRWYAMEIKKEENDSLSPQEIQKKYSGYSELISSIKQVNKLLTQYADELKGFVYS